MSHCVSLMAQHMRSAPQTMVDLGDIESVIERFTRLAHVYERLYDPARGYVCRVGLPTALTSFFMLVD